MSSANKNNEESVLLLTECVTAYRFETLGIYSEFDELCVDFLATFSSRFISDPNGE